GRASLVDCGQWLFHGDVIRFPGKVHWLGLNMCWRSLPVDRPRLCMGGCQSTFIGSGPGTCYGIAICTTSGSNHIIYRYRGRTTVIVRGQCLCHGDVVACHGDIAWQCLNECWRRCVLNRDRLCMGGCQSTIIRSGPGTCYGIVVCTTSGSNNILYHYDGRTTVIVRGQCLCHGDVILFYGDITWQCFDEC